MLTEIEIDIFLSDQEIQNACTELRKEFIKNEAKYLEINDHDFLSLVMMAAPVDIALANGSISFREEMRLNKQARKYSKGGYFLKKDPVVHAMKYLIKGFDKWRDPFFALIKMILDKFVRHNKDLVALMNSEKLMSGDYKKDILNTPFIVVRLFASLFLKQDENIVSTRSVEKADYERIVYIGKKLDLDSFPIFKEFCETFEVK